MQVFDSTAISSAVVMAAGLLSSLTPSGELWFRYSARPGANEAEAAWLDDCTHRAAQMLLTSNFYLGLHEAFLDLARFSTAALFVEERAEQDKLNGDALSFMNVPLGTFVIDESADRVVDTFFRKFKYTARQAEQKWGRERLPQQIREALEGGAGREGNHDRQFEFIHAIYPRRDGEWDEGEMVPGKRRRIASVYVSVEGLQVVEEDGYYEMPVAVARLTRSNNEIYGRGPSDQVMPEIRMVNYAERDMLRGVNLLVNPPWLLDADFEGKVDNRPGGVTFWNSSASEPKQMQLQNRVDIGEDWVQRKRDVIRQAFFVDMFQMLSNPDAMRREKTAYEVEQMVQERLVLFSPMFARIVRELLNPVLERVFNVMLRGRLFAEPPQGISGYEIDYVSKIALAIKAAQNGALMQMMQVLGTMAQFEPTVAYIVDWRKAARGVARNMGLPSAWQRSDREVEALLEEQAAQSQAASMGPMAEAMDKAAGAVQKLGPRAQEAVNSALLGGGEG